MLQELVHLITAECACRHNYWAVGKLGNTINLKIFNYNIVDLEDLISQSNVHVGTQWYAFSKVQYFLFMSIFLYYNTGC